MVAVSATKIHGAGFERLPEDWPRDPPWMFRLLYGYGGEQWRATSAGMRTFFPRDPTTAKPARDPEGAPMRIATAYFARREFSALSAILFTTATTQSRPWAPRDTDDLALYHNPLARNPLPRGWLGGGIEFYAGMPDAAGGRQLRQADLRSCP